MNNCPLDFMIGVIFLKKPSRATLKLLIVTLSLNYYKNMLAKVIPTKAMPAIIEIIYNNFSNPRFDR